MKVKEFRKLLDQLRDDEELFIVKTDREAGMATREIDLERITIGHTERQIGWMITVKQVGGVKH